MMVVFTLHISKPGLFTIVCCVRVQDVCTYLSPPASPPHTLGAIGIGSSSPREQPIHPSFPSPRKQPHHPSFSAPEGPATLSCHLPLYMNTEHAQSWPSINVSRKWAELHKRFQLACKHMFPLNFCHSLCHPQLYKTIYVTSENEKKSQQNQERGPRAQHRPWQWVSHVGYTSDHVRPVTITKVHKYSETGLR